MQQLFLSSTLRSYEEVCVPPSKHWPNSHRTSGSYYRLYAKLERCSSDPQTIPGVNCSTDPYNYCVSSPNIACALYAPSPTPTPLPTPTPTPTLSPTPTPTPIPLVIGCADGTTEQDFGLANGKKVHGCDGTVAFADAETVCTTGWHAGDVVGDSGLAPLLRINIGNSIRWVRMNSDPGGLTGSSLSSPGVDCWGNPLAAGCISVVSSFRPVHTYFPTHATSKTFLNAVLITEGYVVNGLGLLGAICVQN